MLVNRSAVMALVRAIPALLIGVFFIVIAGFMSDARMDEMRLGQGSSDWHVVEAEVIRSNFVTRGGSGRTGGSSRLDFEYRYEVDGATYANDRVAFTTIWKNRVTDDYPKRAVVQIFYDPADPRQSVIEPGVAPLERVVSLAPGLVVVLLGVGLGTWSVRSAFA